MLRQSLKTVLEKYEDVTVIGEATDGAEAVSMAAHLRREGILMDITMPRMGWMSRFDPLRRFDSTHMKEAMKQAGASDFVSKEAAVEELFDTLVAFIPMPIGSKPRLPF